MFDGRPAYWFGATPDQTIVYADDGTLQDGYPAELNLRTAGAWANAPPNLAKIAEVHEPDQWTVGGDFRGEGRLFKYSFADGQEVYVSQTSGQVLQYTTRASRLGAYFGAIPHWLYFTPLRKNVKLWSRIVIWSSGIGTLMAISGLIVGLLVYSPSNRYRYAGEPAAIPYSGTKRLHMIFGLFFGIVACTWAFSGMLSMDPFPSLVPGAAPDELRISNALRGESIDLSSFSAMPPTGALESLPPGLRVKELELISFAGEPVYIAGGVLGKNEEPKSWIVPVHGTPQEMFERDRMVDVIRKALLKSGEPATLVESRMVNRYDAYYLDRTGNRDGDRPLPVLFVRIKGESDAGYYAGYYIDPRTARIVGRYAPDAWSNRWLYHGLHSLNFPWLYNYRPAWDIVVLLLLAGGTTLSVTSAILAWKLLRRKIVG
jgi:hypothetical protein